MAKKNFSMNWKQMAITGLKMGLIIVLAPLVEQLYTSSTGNTVNKFGELLIIALLVPIFFVNDWLKNKQ